MNLIIKFLALLCLIIGLPVIAVWSFFRVFKRNKMHHEIEELKAMAKKDKGKGVD